MYWKRILFSVLLVGGTAAVLAVPLSQHHKLQAVKVVEQKGAAPVRVMTIGGSVAHGWKAASGDGYLQRAFSSLSKSTPVRYEVYDKTIVGANGTQLSTMYKGRYETWLNQVKPDIVVISWGLLNDAKPNTPMATFRANIKQEIQVALNHNADVFMVTPPVTKASYTEFKVQESDYARNEMAVAKSFHSPHVYVFDVYGQMQQYLAEHHQTYQPYAADGWHPNSAGHQVAGNLLSNDISKKFKPTDVTN